MHDVTTADLRDAIEAHALPVHFRPIVRLIGVPLGFEPPLVAGEAVLGWDHPQQGEFRPTSVRAAFAGDTALSRLLGRHLLACAIAAAAPTGAEITVDVSRFDLGTGEALVAFVAEALWSSGMSPADLTIELPRGSAPGEAATAARELQLLGVQVYSSDPAACTAAGGEERSFVDGIKLTATMLRIAEHSPKGRGLVGRIVARAHSTGLTVVADGVVSNSRSALVRELGCDWARGSFYGPPSPAIPTSLPS